jgi:hypothetical protein
MPTKIKHQKVKKYSKTKKCQKKREKKVFRKRSRKMRGGLAQVNDWQSCPNAKLACNWFDKHYTANGKVNETWDTCIDMNGIKNHIIYITSQNVAIKSIESLQVPEFKVKLPTENEPIKCKIMIEDKYVGCFLNICGQWYVIMRLLGTTINTGMLALTETNKAYYRITNIEIDAKDPETGSSLITIPQGSYTESNESPTLATSSTPVIKLNDSCFKNINKEDDTFNVLQRFRQQKIWANAEKQEVAANLAGDVVENVFRFW